MNDSHEIGRLRWIRWYAQIGRDLHDSDESQESQQNGVIPFQVANDQVVNEALSELCRECRNVRGCQAGKSVRQVVQLNCHGVDSRDYSLDRIDQLAKKLCQV